ncbi:hypothetical protein X947_5021 [Burkholderia pseudomallei MSHR7334]|nr:hypothetical protein X947_5021 [Burkholderia pseudomallei MSHR7334]
MEPRQNTHLFRYRKKLAPPFSAAFRLWVRSFIPSHVRFLRFLDSMARSRERRRPRLSRPAFARGGR